MSLPPLTPALRRALELLYDAITMVQIETQHMDQEARAKYLSNRIAQRHFERQGKPAIDNPRLVATVVAEILMLMAISLDDT